MTKNSMLRFLPAVLLSALMLAVGAFGQSGTGSITGVVADANGANVKGATVTLTSKATNETKTATTSDDGIYTFTLLKPGQYLVDVAASGFGGQKLDVEVQVGRTTDANATLTAGNVNAVVEVSAEGVQTTTSNFDAVQNEQAIQNLPINGRRFQDFVTLTPTAQVDPSRGQISLSGQRGINTNINVDGVDYNQPFFGGIRGGERANSSMTLPQEGVKEFQVVAAGYNAEYGRSSGGIVNAVTKSGTNEVRGSLFYLLRPSRLARPNDFAKELAVQRLNALGINATLAPTQHQVGGSIGGPVVKDKFFYFGTLEVQRFKAPRQVLYGNLIGFTPTATQTEAYNFYRANELPFEQTNNAIAYLAKADWNVNSANRFSFRFNHSQNKALNGVSTGETALDPTTSRSISTNGTEEDRNNIFVAQLVSTFSSHLINEFRGQYAKEVRPRTPNAIVANINTSIGEYGTRNFLPTTQFDTRWQAGDNVTYLRGNHNIKFGGEFSRLRAAQVFGFNQNGVYSFSGLSSAAGILDALGTTRTATFRGRLDTTTARYAQQIGNLKADFQVKEASMFVQDAWRVTPKLTLNFGLRWEKQYNPEAEANNSPVLSLVRSAAWPLYGGASFDPSSIPDSPNQWGPRFGFAWDPKGDGKMVIRGFAGEYYARTPLIVLAGPFNNFRNPAGDLSVTLGNTFFSSAGFNQATFEANNPQYVSIVGGTGFTPNTVYRQFAILGIDLNSKSLASLPTLTPAQIQTISAALLAATTNPPQNLGVFQGADFTGIDPNFKNPQSFQWGGGIEREWWKDVTVGADFEYVNTVHLQRNRDINIPAPSGVDAAGRVILNRANRPVPSIGRLQIRESSARSLYRALTLRLNVNKRWGGVNAFYTFSRSLSDDDNERDSGGVLYSNPYNLQIEYYNSRLDRRHQFVANPRYNGPWGIEISSAIRFRSGVPINSLVGSDLNADSFNNERPMISYGTELRRNWFTNRPLYDIDLRVQKAIHFSEHRRLTLSAEFFNILNRTNAQFSGSSTTNFCASASVTCGLNGVTNINFMNLIQQTTTATNYGRLNIGGLNPGSQVFQMQLGARFYF